MVRTILLLTAAAGLIGCAHREEMPPPSTASYAEQSKEAFASAYDAVKSGARATADAGKYALQAVGSGTVRVWDRTKALAGAAGGAVEDGWITTKVKSEYAVDPMVKATNINVDTNDGVVRLTGYVQSPEAAQRAIQTALATKGVVAVDSNLAFPGAAQPQGGVYVPPPPQ